VRSLRFSLTTLAAVALPILATAAVAVTGGTAALAAGPTAAQLLAKTSACTPASTGKYATDEGGAATVDICKTGSAYFWQSDLDIDCDGISTTHCNSSTDPSYWHETSFETSTGAFFTADVTHYFVVPLPSSRFNYGTAGIQPGNVGAVVYNNKIVYAVFADEGPDDIIGEASYATAQALGIDPDPATGGTAGPVTFIVFTGTVPSPVENNTAIDQSGATAATAFVGSTTTPPSTGGPITGIGSKCVDVSGASSTDGAAIQLYTCNGTAAQTWTTGTDHTVRALGKCLDVTSASTTNGARVQLYTCNGTAAQQWTLSGGELINTGSGKCLDATGVQSTDGTPLQIWSCTGASNQLWTVTA
jgi:hypothetical protein